MEILRSIQPAVHWRQSLPLGDGRFGAMVEGGIAVERILFNHEELFLPKDSYTDPHTDHAAFFESLKKELMAGNYRKAERMTYERYPISNPDTEALVDGGQYLPLCELIMETHIKGEKVRYQRQIDCRRAEAVVSWDVEDTHYVRRQFVSRADHEFVLEISNSRNEKMNSTFCLNARSVRDPKVRAFLAKHVAFNQQADPDGFRFEGELLRGGRFGASLRFVTDGAVSIEKDELGFDVLSCRNYTTFTAYVTGYAGDAQPHEPVIAPYDALFARHLALYRPLYDRVKLDLGYTSERSMEELLLEASYETPDPALYSLMFHYSRYLFISCAVDCRYPPNLQGIWNGDYEPAWNSDFHNDENIQICMWPGLPMQFPESVRTYMDFYSSFLEEYRQRARRYFAADGIAVPIAQTLWPACPGSGFWGWCPGMAGWIGQLFYEYWLYTRDKDILQTRVVPWLEETARFYMSFCTVTDGKCQFIPSFSPENMPVISMPAEQQTQDNLPSWLSVNATYDVAVAREVFGNLIRAYAVLGRDSSEYQRWLAMMPDYRINGDGALSEWLNEELGDNYEHRHLSHLYPFFPGHEITGRSDKALYEAVRKATEMRLTEGLTASSGWGLTHMANVFARLGMAEDAFTCLKILLRTVVLNNGMTLHNDYRPQGNNVYWDFDFPIQIDGVLGFPSVIAEMFASSEDGYLKIAPAVPKLFGNARLSGLAVKDNITMDITMKDGAPETVVLTAAQETTLTVELSGNVRTLTLHSGENVL